MRLASEAGDAPVDGFALPDWRERAARADEPPMEARLLAPFDPIVRDRRRARRVFGFDYRFEAFVPAERRRHGYYVLPVVVGDRPIARIDAKHCRDDGRLEIRALFWEPGAASPAHRRRLEEGIGALCHRIGAADFCRTGPEGVLSG